MSFRDDVLQVLSGGLPALIETPTQGTAVNSDAARPETVAPEPTNRDTEPFLMRVTQPQILGATAVVLALLGVVFVIGNR